MKAILHKQVLAHLPDGITIQDRDFNIIYQNDAMKHAFGEHVGMRCYAIYERRDEVCEGCGVQKAFQTGEPNIVLRTAFEVDGKTSYWENSCFPLFDSEGNITAGVEVCRNITDRVSLTSSSSFKSSSLTSFSIFSSSADNSTLGSLASSASIFDSSFSKALKNLFRPSITALAAKDVSSLIDFIASSLPGMT